MIDSWAPGHPEVLPSPSLIWHWVTGPTSEPFRTCVSIVSLHTGPLCAGHSVPLSAPLRTECWEFLSLLSNSLFLQASHHRASLSPATEQSPHGGQHAHWPLRGSASSLTSSVRAVSGLSAQLGTMRLLDKHGRDQGTKMTEPASMVRLALGHQSSALSHDNETFCGHSDLSKSLKDTVLGGQYL